MHLAPATLDLVLGPKWKLDGCLCRLVHNRIVRTLAPRRKT